MAIHAPHLFINAYLREKIGTAFGATAPFVPTMPSDIDALVSTFPESDGMFAVYDRMFKMRRKAFPHIKCEQLLYYFYKTDDPTLLYRTHGLIQDLLDRGDESAQEVNSWIYKKWVEAGEPTVSGIDIVTENTEVHNAYNFGSSLNPEWILLPYFHEIKVFQLEETRDVIEIGASRTVVGNKIIIDYEWHSS